MPISLPNQVLDKTGLLLSNNLTGSRDIINVSFWNTYLKELDVICNGSQPGGDVSVLIPSFN